MATWLCLQVSYSYPIRNGRGFTHIDFFVVQGGGSGFHFGCNIVRGANTTGEASTYIQRG